MTIRTCCPAVPVKTYRAASVSRYDDWQLWPVDNRPLATAPAVRVCCAQPAWAACDTVTLRPATTMLPFRAAVLLLALTRTPTLAFPDPLVLFVMKIHEVEEVAVHAQPFVV